jgi:hypothetical protein
MTPEQRAAALVAEWDRPESTAPGLDAKFIPWIVNQIAAPIRDAERAAYERAAKEISCACLDEPECLQPHACCREDVAAILSLIDKEPAE